MELFSSPPILVLLGLMWSGVNAASSADFKALDLKASYPLPTEPEVASVEVTVVPSETVLVNGQSVAFKYRTCEPSGNPSGMGLLLLHGAGTTSATWSEVKTTQTMCALGHKVVAMDLPGFGGSPSCNRCDRAETLAAVLNRFFPTGASGQLGKPAVVVPSYAGSFVFPYIRKYKDDLAIGSLITVAPVDVGPWDDQLFSTLQLPTFIFYGETDYILGARSAEHLVKLPLSAKPQVIKNAGHVTPYKDASEDWHTMLANFLAFVKKHASSTA